ncbi:hypothetical protein OpiT1DRAFT_00291 [Opitutaceae bacterium TAV1]|nr:hypothetical protein OpiT1DRAFT_00291 [Opitutaceae bacterium TAV1]
MPKNIQTRFSLLLPRIIVFPAAVLAIVPPLVAAITNIDVNYSAAVWYADENELDIASYDWDSAGNLYYAASVYGYMFGGIYKYDTSGVATQVFGGDANTNFSGASLVTVGNHVYFNPSSWSNSQYIYKHDTTTSATARISSTTNYGLYAHNGVLFITGAGNAGAANFIARTALDAQGNLVNDPAINLGVTGGASGPMAFDAQGNLYYAPGMGRTAIYKWSAQQVADAIADPDASPLCTINNVEDFLWYDYTLDFSGYAGGTSMAVDENGNIYLTLTNFSSGSEIVFFDVDGSSSPKSIVSSDMRLGEIRYRDGILYVADGFSIYQVTTVSPVPESSTWALLCGFNILAFVVLRRRLSFLIIPLLPFLPPAFHAKQR